MKTVSSFHDLEQFGIVYLTGESDALMFRGLCDLDRMGVKVVCELLSIKEDGLSEPWNSGGVASILLSRDMILPIAIIGFLRQGCHTVIRQDDCVIGLSSSERIEQTENGWLLYQERYGEKGIPWPECYGKIVQVFKNRDSYRNTHSMSGRIE